MSITRVSDALVHPHTGEPIVPVGFRRDGRPIWPIMGASEDDAAGADQADDDSEGEEADSEGDAEGESEEEVDWKAKFEAQQKVNRKLERRTKQDKALIDKLKSDQSEKEKDESDVEKIRAEAYAEAKREALKERVLDKIEAKASKFVDPEDAAAILLRRHNVDEFIDDDSIDVEAIVDALDDLAENKPHLVNGAKGGRRFGGSADGGARTTKPKRAGSLEEAVSQKYTK